MSQNDFNIANQGFPATRADINSALQALASTSSGATEPGTIYAYQFWYDTSTNLLKMRNADNDAWITLAAFDQAADEWEVRTAVVQAVDSAGVVIKTDDGVARISVADNGNVTIANNLTVSGNIDVSSGTIKLDGNYPVGTSNVALGDAALDDGALSGSANTAIGDKALSANTSGEHNTAVGRTGLFVNTTGSSNSTFGSAAMESNTTGGNNVAVGRAALYSNTTASGNTAVGYQAAYANTTGANVEAFGYQALFSNTTGLYNSAFGYTALSSNTTGNANIAVGRSALNANTTGGNNVAIGLNSLYLNTTASSNTALGYVALYSNQTGASNTAVGRSALYATTGGFNTAVGENAGGAITTGTKNTILGRYDGNQGGLDIRTSNNNIVLSDGDGNPRLRVTSSGQFIMVGVYNDTTADAANVNVRSDGLHRRSTSSIRYKHSVENAPFGVAELMKLRPVTYKGNNDGDRVFGGLIAEEVHDAGLTEFVQYDTEGRPDALAYGNMVSLCVKAIQEQQATIEALETRLAALEAN